MESPPFRLQMPVSANVVLLLLLHTLLYSYCSAFNIDVKKAFVHHKKNEYSSFGYALDFFLEPARPGIPAEWSLMVGAPTAVSPPDSKNFERIRDTGIVYKCGVSKAVCREVIFDSNGNEEKLHGSEPRQIEEKSKERLGSTVVSSKKGDKFVACAPHYTYFFSKFELRDPVGRCFYVDRSFDNITQFTPCLKEQHDEVFTGYHRLGFGLCGHSAAVPESLNRVFVGAPGAYYLQGSVFAQNTRNKLDRPNTLNQSAYYDNTYLGFSTAIGDFNGDGNEDVVAGVPRFDACGAVKVLSHRLDVITNLTDENCQLGQQLGTALAVTDLNGDGYDDIIAGAPFYTAFGAEENAKTHKKKPKYEVGKVVIFFQKSGKRFTTESILGDREWSRFGYSVAAVGDLNQDKYNDFVVGAPYGGQDGNGAVYVFHGSKDGVRKTPTQIIEARDVRSNMQTFGFSVAGGKDIDGNQYPDIAVGAYKTAHAVIFRTKPVVRVKGDVHLTSKSVNLASKHCSTSVGKMACVDLDYALDIEDRPKAPNKVELKVIAQVDSKMPKPRAFFVASDLDSSFYPHPKSVSKAHPNIIEGTIPLKKRDGIQKKLRIYVPDTIRDKLTPISVTLNYTLVETVPNTMTELDAALDTTLPTSYTTELKIDKNCGSDEKCVPDLSISVKPSKEKFTIGGIDEKLVVNVTVENRGEDAYESQFFITIPPEFEYGGIVNYDGKSKIPCDSVGKVGNGQGYVFRCDLGNPIPSNKKVRFGIHLAAGNVSYASDEIVIQTLVNSTNEEAEGRNFDNVVNVTLGLDAKAQLVLNSKSEPPEIVYSIRNMTLVADYNDPREVKAHFDSQIGPLVTHVFEVHNRGPSAIRKARLDIVWPSYFTNRQHLLYLIDVPEIESPVDVKCQMRPIGNLNPESLTVTYEHRQTRSTKSTLTSSDERKTHQREHLNEQYENYALKRKIRHLKSVKPKTGSEKRVSRNSDTEYNELFKNELSKIAGKAKEYHGVAIPYSGYLNRTTIKCGDRDCTHIFCDITNLNALKSVVVSVHSRLVLNTAIETFADVQKSYEITSVAVAEVVEMPFKAGYKQSKQILSVTTNLNPTDPEKSKDGIPWWLILLAILIGLLILLLLILCLWRCGFFKRKRPPAEHATYNKGSRNQEVFADSQMRYAKPYMYDEEKHGSRL